MADLRVNLFGKQLAGPVIAASGTFGFGPEYAGIEDLRVLGGISGKGLTLNGQPGNDGERLLETPSGLMNSIGLQNPGVQHFIENELPAMKTCGTAVWVNLGGHTIEENVEGVQKLCAAGIDVLELNISCPNVKQGGLAFGIRAKDAEEVVSAVRKVCTVPLVVKLSPQAESIPDMCKAVEAAGADGISLCNTFQACAIDLEKRRPVFNNTFAGLSGPAIRPIALRMVWQAVGAVNIPVIGLGGILTGRDALEFIMAGAAAVQVGTANFLDPKACTRITAEIGEWMDAHGVKTLDEIRYTGDDQEVYFRKSQGDDEDNSGVYNTYSQETTINMGEAEVTCKGDSDAYELAIWQQGGYSYSISLQIGISLEELQAMIETVED